MENYILGTNIKKAREKMGLTQGELSKLTGITTTQISHIERGKSYPHAKTLNKILDALDVDKNNFFRQCTGVINLTNFSKQDQLLMLMFYQKLSNLSEEDKSIIRQILNSGDA